MPADPLALLRSRSYLVLLAAIIGAPVSAAAYGFLAVVSKMGCAQQLMHGHLVCSAGPPDRNTTFISGSPR